MMDEESKQPHPDQKTRVAKTNDKTAKSETAQTPIYGVQKVAPVTPDRMSRTEQTTQLMVRRGVKVFSKQDST